MFLQATTFVTIFKNGHVPNSWPGYALCGVVVWNEPPGENERKAVTAQHYIAKTSATKLPDVLLLLFADADADAVLLFAGFMHAQGQLASFRPKLLPANGGFKCHIP